jgi:hypothetical protein
LSESTVSIAPLVQKKHEKSIDREPEFEKLSVSSSGCTPNLTVLTSLF